MTCVECGGDLVVGVATRFLTLSQHAYLVVENVPASVCERCGTAYKDTATTDAILALVERVRGALPPGARGTVTYAYDDVAQATKTA